MTVTLCIPKEFVMLIADLVHDCGWDSAGNGAVSLPKIAVAQVVWRRAKIDGKGVPEVLVTRKADGYTRWFPTRASAAEVDAWARKESE